MGDRDQGHDCNDVDILVCPCTIQEGEVLLSTKNITSGNGQSGHGNLLRCKPCWQLENSDTGSGRGRFLQGLTGDSTPSVDGTTYCRNRLQSRFGTKFLPLVYCGCPELMMRFGDGHFGNQQPCTG